METKLAEILDECIARLRKGEKVEDCLNQYPSLREQIAPLLRAAVSVSALPRVKPSAEFREESKARLMSRLRQQSLAVKAKSRQETLLLGSLAAVWQGLCRSIIGARKVAIPVALAVVVMLVASIGAFNLLSPTPALASQCTLSILSGSAEVQRAGEDAWKQGANGMTLASGDRVKTAPDSHAMLTFFEGSTVTLEANTDLQIEQVGYSNEQSTTIVMKQWLGRTWSRVVRMADPGSHYRIDTPTASAIVRGTLFATEVDQAGGTGVATTEGIVSVVAQGEEVDLPANRQTHVEAGAGPSQPAAMPDPETQIVITIDSPAVGSVVSPDGSSTGYLPGGLSYNQITGSRSSSPSEGEQTITIPQPGSGEYTLVLRYLTPGSANFNIQGKSADKVAFNYSGTYGAEGDGGWIIRFNINMEGGQIVGSGVNGVNSLGGESPEKIVKSQQTVSSPDATKPPAKEKSEEPEDNGKAQTEDVEKGQPEDKGKAQTEDVGKGQSEDKGKAQTEDVEKVQSGDKGQPQDNGKGQSGDKGQPQDNGKGQSEDKGQPQDNDKGQSEDKGQPQDNGKGQSEDKGKGQSEDKGQPQGNGKGQSEDKGQPQDNGKGQSGGKGQPQDNGKGQSGNIALYNDNGNGQSEDIDEVPPENVGLYEDNNEDQAEYVDKGKGQPEDKEKGRPEDRGSKDKG